MCYYNSCCYNSCYNNCCYNSCCYYPCYTYCYNSCYYPCCVKPKKKKPKTTPKNTDVVKTFSELDNEQVVINGKLYSLLTVDETSKKNK